MAKFYFDVETTGLNPKVDKIISIQYWQLDGVNNAIGELTILKEWDSCEKDILSEFNLIFKPWQFIPVGCNMNFDKHFISQRNKLYKLNAFDFEFLIRNFPSIDIHPMLVLMNNGNFKGSSLHNFSSKRQSGEQVPKWYAGGEFGKVEEYVKNEAEAFIEVYKRLNEKLKI